MTLATALALLFVAVTPTGDGIPEAPVARVELTGEVIDGAGKSIVGAGVFVIGRRDVGVDLRHIQNWPSWSVTGRTDARGKFRASSVLGPVMVLAVRPGKTAGGFVGRAVPIDAGSRSVPVRLQFRGSAEISGRVMDMQGRPVAGVAVSAYPEPSAAAPPGGAAFGSGVSGADGAFTVSGLHPGAYRLFGSGAGYWCECGFLEGASARTGNVDVVVPVVASGMIRGQVLEAAPAGGVIPPDRFVVETPAMGGWEFDSADGTFEVPIVRPWAGLPILVWSKGSRVLAFATFRVSLDQGESRDLGRIVLSPGRTVRGRVVDSKGAPIQGAALSPGFEGYAAAKPLGVTGNDGRFELNGLEESDASVRVSHPNFRRTEYLVPQGGQDVEIRMFAASSARVRVEDVDGSPLGGATVRAMSPQGRGTCVSDPSGICVIGGLAAGDYALEVGGVRGVDVPRPPTWQLRVRVPEDGPGEARFRYPRRPSNLRVHALAHDGTFANAWVAVIPGEVSITDALADLNHVRLPYYGTGIDLEHPVRNLSPDRYTVLAVGNGGRCGTTVVDLPDGADLLVTVRLPATGGNCIRPSPKP